MMKSLNFRFFLSAVCLASVLSAFGSTAVAAPVQFNQVTQIINAKPGKANTGSFSSLRLAGNEIVTFKSDGDGDDGKPKTTQQDDRVITETKIEIVEDEVCDCVDPQLPISRGFPQWALLGLAAAPLAFVFTKKDDPTPTRTPTISETATPTVTPTVTPTTTPTPPEPVPEPMTILLFGTGLAGIGVAARKRFGKKEKQDNEK
jgi:PEP-CTERM motif